MGNRGKIFKQSWSKGFLALPTPDSRLPNLTRNMQCFTRNILAQTATLYMDKPPWVMLSQDGLCIVIVGL
jgi:hypothetical protein